MRNLINYDLTCGTQPTRSAAHFVGARAVPVYRAPSATSTTACTPLKIHRGAAGGGGEGGGATLLVLSKEGEALYSLGLRLPTLAAAMEFANAHDGMSAGGRPAVRVARCRDGRRGDGVFATRPIAAHETIFVESPMASVPRFWDTPTANATSASSSSAFLPVLDTQSLPLSYNFLTLLKAKRLPVRNMPSINRSIRIMNTALTTSLAPSLINT